MSHNPSKLSVFFTSSMLVTDVGDANMKSHQQHGSQESTVRKFCWSADRTGPDNLVLGPFGSGPCVPDGNHILRTRRSYVFSPVFYLRYWYKVASRSSGFDKIINKLRHFWSISNNLRITKWEIRLLISVTRFIMKFCISKIDQFFYSNERPAIDWLVLWSSSPRSTGWVFLKSDYVILIQGSDRTRAVLERGTADKWATTWTVPWNLPKAPSSQRFHFVQVRKRMFKLFFFIKFDSNIIFQVSYFIIRSNDRWYW